MPLGKTATSARPARARRKGMAAALLTADHTTGQSPHRDQAISEAE